MAVIAGCSVMVASLIGVGADGQTTGERTSSEAAANDPGLRAVVWSPNLQASASWVQSITTDGGLLIRAMSEDADVLSIAPEDWVRVDFSVEPKIRPDPSSSSVATPLATLVLIDGQHLAGGIASDLAVEESIVWDHPALGRLMVPLDQVASVNPGWADPDPTRPPVAPPVFQDTLWLANGETLEGFVASCSETTLGLIPTGASEPIQIPHSGILQAALANPPRQAAGPWTLRLIDGSVLHAADLTMTSDGWQATLTLDLTLASTDFAPDAPPTDVITWPHETVVSIEQRFGGHRLVDLSREPAEMTQGGAVLGLPTPPRWIGGRWCLQAPITWTWPLSGDLTAVRFHLSIDPLAAGPDQPTPRTHCVAELQAIGHRSSQPLNATNPQVTLVHSQSLETAGHETETSIILSLDEGADGPVHDRVCLLHAWAVESMAFESDESDNVRPNAAKSASESSQAD